MRKGGGEREGPPRLAQEAADGGEEARRRFRIYGLGLRVSRGEPAGVNEEAADGREEARGRRGEVCSQL